MINAEEMIDRYKKEIANLTERCLNAEYERDVNDGAYRYQCSAVDKFKAKNKDLEALLKEAEERNTQLLSRLDLMKEALEDNGIVLPYEEDYETRITETDDGVEITTDFHVKDRGAPNGEV